MRPVCLAVLAAAVSLPVAPVHAQAPKTDQYLRQVAAAVQGYSAGGPVWVVICGDTAGTYDVIGAYPTAVAAQEVAAAKGHAQRTVCSVEGPYQSTLTYASTTDPSYGAGCKKGPDSDCVGDSTATFIAPLSSVQSVTITYRMRDGRPPVSETFDPHAVEAIFFTMSAADRMLIPYYLRVYGANGAMRRRRALLSRFGAHDVN